MISEYATNIALVDRATMTVTNVIWGGIYQEEEFTNDEQIAVVVGGLSVEAGDTYDGEKFYHEGEVVLSTRERIADMEAALAVLLGGAE